MPKSFKEAGPGFFEYYGGFGTFWPLLPLLALFYVVLLGLQDKVARLHAQSSPDVATQQARHVRPVPPDPLPRYLTEGRVVSTLSGPYRDANLSTVRRRWLQPTMAGGMHAELFSPYFPAEVHPDPVDVYGALAGGAEDEAKIKRHLEAWDILLKNVRKDKPRIAIATTTYENLEVIRNWIGYHMSLGIGYYYLYMDGRLATDEAMERLNRWIPKENVKLIPRTLAVRDEQGKNRVWKEGWLAPFFHLPCNSDLFVKQNLNLMGAMDMVHRDKIDWVIHIDTDELLHPGKEFNHSMQLLLESVPDRWKYVEFANYEGLPEREDVKDPFAEVTLFKRSHLHMPEATYRKVAGKVRNKNGVSFTVAYSNGKSAARVREGLRPNGAHKFSNYKAPLDKKRMAEEYWIPHPSAYLAHYVYNKFHDVESRRDRCDCLPTHEDAPRCFMLSFDREAFIAASTLNQTALRKWYHDRLVWDDERQKQILTEDGCLFREDFFATRTQMVEKIFEEHS